MTRTVATEVSAVPKMITRWASVRANRSGTEAIAATRRRPIRINARVVETMPRPQHNRMKVLFFRAESDISCKALEKLYAEHGLIPVDPYTLAAINEADPTFADQYWNATQWKDADGEFCFAFFNSFGPDKRHVRIAKGSGSWHRSWWFAGVAIKQ